ncbi:MAG: AraC family transcriptional regulator [Balneolaceae bacterium]
MFEDASVKSLLADYPDLLINTVHGKEDFMKQPVVLELNSSSFVESIFKSSLEYLKQPTTESVISLKFKFQELLVNLLREKGSNLFPIYLSWICNDESVAFVKLMRENSHFNFTTKELARTADMSLSTFKRIFKKHFNLPPGKWLREQRILNAISLLSNTDYTVSEIAYKLGYNDTAAFSKAFKGATHHNPTDYRKKPPG